MSRETDSPSSGPNGRGGTAYPSGTPPYGTPMASDGAADAGRTAGDRPEQPKTETTLTTRIRINIPGSRPIPPVVVRKPVANAESSDATGASRSPAQEAGPASVPGGPVDSDTGSHPLPGGGGGAEEKRSDWFAPRKAGAPKGGPGGGNANGAGMAAGSNAQGPAAGGGGGVGPSGAPGTPTARPGGNAGGAGGTGPVAPGHGGGTGSFDVSRALAAGPLGAGPGGGSPYPTGGQAGDNGAAEPRRDGLPYFSDGGQNGQNGQGGPAGPTGGPASGDTPLAAPGVPGGQGFPAGPGGPGGSEGPGGPGGAPGGQAGPGGHRAIGGPGSSGAPAGPGGHRAPGGQGAPGNPGLPAGPGGQAGPGSHRAPGGPGAPGGPDASGFPGGKGPQSGSAFSGAPAGAARPGGGLSDDTAILTPQVPAPEPGAPGYGGAGENVSGHTLTSGIPVVPPAPNSPFGPGAHTDGPLPHQPPKLPEPVSPAAPAAARPKKKKKGRNKLVLLVTGVVALGGIAYGAGLLMNHSDVPKGTSVLGVDIGGGTRDEAVQKLDDAFKASAAKPLQLSVEGDTVALKPDQAGLQLDTQATVRAAAGSDYNPVSVVGSLFGNQRVVAPVMPVDEEKLAAALEGAAGGSGSATEGTIKFQSGKAVPVYGKAGQGIDIDRSTKAVEDAYRTQVETGKSAAVKVPTTAKEPKVSKAEVDRMMKEFAQPAMSGLVTVKAGAAVVQFSPENSLWKFLGVKATPEGKLVDYYDLPALKELYGGAFDGVTIARGNGKKTAVTPQDVVVALRQALVGKTAADRVGVIETNPT
ncbi:hypothetical protein [Streptomyces ortus]|uniref:Peptidoglycan binding domain-containing protein n=1 Tax=Streptomyces ortus TaxID=2867268 RepID=A0ABT3V5Q6_9ACTN|nr:hypothetical protein [Streptomyces ortus]MCX4234259.1 hypothetical protein [Streptomyces ortus]